MYKNIIKIFFLMHSVFMISSYAHSLPDDDTLVLLAKGSVNYLPKVLNESCNLEDETIKKRITSLDSLLSKKLTIDEICQGLCVQSASDGKSREGVTRGELESWLEEIARQKTAKNEKACTKFLTFLESVSQRYSQSLADLVQKKNTDVPSVIYELESIGSDAWVAMGETKAVGEIEESKIHIKVSYPRLYEFMFANGNVDVKASAYDFGISYYRDDPYNNYIKIDKVKLKVEGKTYVGKITKDNNICCRTKSINVHFDREGPIGREPFELVVIGVRDGSVEYPPLNYKTVGQPAGLLNLPKVLQELLNVQWSRN